MALVKKEPKFRVERRDGKACLVYETRGTFAMIEIKVCAWKDQTLLPRAVGSLHPTPETAHKHFWIFRGHAYSTPEYLQASDVRALILEKENRVQAAIARARAIEAQATAVVGKSRRPIPDDVKMFVWQRDGGRCVSCRSNKGLEFDHIIPVVMGGADTARNLQLLCERCNRSKGGALV